MASNQYQDLNALLKTLSAYVPPAEDTQIQHYRDQPHFRTAPIDDDFQARQRTSSSYSISSQQNGLSSAQHERGTFPEQLDSRIQLSVDVREAASPPRKNLTQAQLVDPRTIMEWPAALRYVTRLIAKDDDIGRAIERMIIDQQRNEIQWWTDRELLLEKQRARVEGKRQLDRVLLAVGGQLSTEHLSEDQNEKEVQNFDLKVHKAARDMSHAMSTELAALGIPFFGIRPHLIREELVGSEDRKTLRREFLSRDELQALKVQMINFLEDMFK